MDYVGKHLKEADPEGWDELVIYSKRENRIRQRSFSSVMSNFDAWDGEDEGEFDGLHD